MSWQSAVDHARRVGRAASELSLRRTDGAEIARAYDAVAEAWDVAGDALEEAGLLGTAEDARRVAGSNRRVAESFRTGRYLVVRGVVRRSEVRKRVSTAIPDVWTRGPADRPGRTGDDLQIRLTPLVRHIRQSWPAQRPARGPRFVRLFADPTDAEPLLEVLDIYGGPRALDRLVRTLEQGLRPPRRGG